MRKPPSLFIFLSAVLGVMYAFPAPMYYTFTGKIGFVPQDQGGYAAAHNIKSGNSVTYVFAIDTTAPGFFLTQGVKTELNDTTNVGTGHKQRYFVDSLAAPSLFSDAITNHADGEFYGFQTTTVLGSATRYTAAIQTILGDENTQVQVIIYVPDTSATVFLPKVGDVLSGGETYSDSTAFNSSATSSLTLTAISATKPVIGILARPAAPGAWMQADLNGSSLLLQNRSGREAEAKIVTVSGKTALSLTLGKNASVPVSALPNGLFFLKVSAIGEGASVTRAFVR